MSSLGTVTGTVATTVAGGPPAAASASLATPITTLATIATLASQVNTATVAAGPKQVTPVYQQYLDTSEAGLWSSIVFGQVTLITTPSGAEAQPLVQDLPVSIMASPTSEDPGSTTSTVTTTTAEGETGEVTAAGADAATNTTCSFSCS